jgi:hypothetical protein
MTGQEPDSLTYKKYKYDIINSKGDGLFIPEDYGVEPVPHSTSCWRGFIADYTIKQSKLYLQKLKVASYYPASLCGHNGYNKLNGVYPRAHSDDSHEVYTGLDLPIDFDGWLQVARDFIPDMYVHMGFQLPEAFNTVLQMEFEDGYLKNVYDVSEKVKEKRENMM